MRAGLVLRRHWRTKSGMLVLLFLSLIPMWVLASDGVYRPIETYMRNSTSLFCTKNDFRSVLEAAVTCYMDNGCRAASTLAGEDEDGGFGVCKCVTDATHRILSSDKLELYLRVNGEFNKGKTLLCEMAIWSETRKNIMLCPIDLVLMILNYCLPFVLKLASNII